MRLRYLVKVKVCPTCDIIATVYIPAQGVDLVQSDGYTALSYGVNGMECTHATECQKLWRLFWNKILHRGK